MQLKELLAEHKSSIKRHWLENIISSYPEGSHEFFLRKGDDFQNPVGAAMTRLVDVLYEALLSDVADSEVEAVMEYFIKMRAVQEFSASQAVGFIFGLKHSIREIISEEISQRCLHRELAELEVRIDKFTLKAFDLYSKSREELYFIRADELRRRSYMAFRLAGSDTD